MPNFIFIVYFSYDFINVNTWFTLYSVAVVSSLLIKPWNIAYSSFSFIYYFHFLFPFIPHLFASFFLCLLCLFVSDLLLVVCLRFVCLFVLDLFVCFFVLDLSVCLSFQSCLRINSVRTDSHILWEVSAGKLVVLISQRCTDPPGVLPPKDRGALEEEVKPLERLCPSGRRRAPSVWLFGSPHGHPRVCRSASGVFCRLLP